MDRVWKVAVAGAYGRMGSQAVQAIEAAQDMELVAALGREDPLETLLTTGAQVLVDLTVPEATETNVRFAVEHNIHAVVGTSGWDQAKRTGLEDLLAQHRDIGVLLAPNFAIGAVLASEFAARAAVFFESVELIEMHHPDKLDAPSGTAVYTAQKIAQARQKAGLGASPDATKTDQGGSRGADYDGVRVHAVRLLGLTASQEILLGDRGQQLLIRHDSFDRASFMPGVLLGIRQVAQHPGLTQGLASYLGL
ncbi:MAG: 4-hydroxy-tetrahydrodipicolinate reductase [Rothia sp. (in: high G+C Gram-positive bacteria)]|nr:4-hydroxy-tetrahydrodipicolinate reductase [Rothia sp. (in: high G+C Gram-positive bacteria)]